MRHISSCTRVPFVTPLSGTGVSGGARSQRPPSGHGDLKRSPDLLSTLELGLRHHVLVAVSEEGDDLDEYLDQVLIGGYEERAIRIVDHDDFWPLLFEAERQQIQIALGSTARRYYDALQGVRERGDLERWLALFLEGVRVQATDAVVRAERLIDLREDYQARV